MATWVPAIEARDRYIEVGVMARRRRDRDGFAVYRLPMSLWRSRDLMASGEWRVLTPGGPMTLIGVALLRAPGLRIPSKRAKR